MKQSEIQKRLIPLIRKTTHTKNDEKLPENIVAFSHDGAFDSVAVLKLIMSIEEEFDITVDEQDIGPANFKTVADLTRYIASKVSQS